MKKLLLILLLTLAGCFGRKQAPYTFPQLPEPVSYETVWVEPGIVLSDSLFTLIRADRIDSVLIDDVSNTYAPVTSSVEFAINQRACFTVINILNTSQEVIMPLVATQLDPGHYRLSLNQPAIKRSGLPVGLYDLRCETCASTVSSRFAVLP